MAMTETRAPSNIEIFRSRLQTRRKELDDALEGSGISADRFIRTAVTCAQTQPELVADVSFQSLWAELLKACRDRLLPDGRQGVIVAFKGRAKWIPMYRGLLDRFEQSGEYKWVTANLRRDDDLAWDFWVDETGQHFLHRPGPGRGKVLSTYAAATTKSGGFFISVVSEADMDHIRSVSRARSEDSPWQQWTDQMRMKTALRRLCKLLPMPQPLEELMQYDDDDEPGAAKPRAISRPRGAQHALEQFAGEPEPEGATGSDRSEPAAEGAEPVPRVLLDTAHERGRQAKIDGHKRTAIPGEYREADRTQEAIAWRKGWDGEPLETGAADGRA
jgi:phage RecT family recombinase